MDGDFAHAFRLAPGAAEKEKRGSAGGAP